MKWILLLTALGAGVMVSAPAFACAPLIATDPVTGQTYGSGSDEWKRREQDEWRARSEVVILAQVRVGQLVSGGDIRFTLTPIISVYGGDLPETDLTLLWAPGHTCNTFTLNLADTVVVYVGADDDIIGVTVPEQLQDRPPEFRMRLREIWRGLIGPPVRP